MKSSRYFKTSESFFSNFIPDVIPSSLLGKFKNGRNTWNRGLSQLFALAVTISNQSANSHADTRTFRKSIINVFENVTALPKHANTHRNFSNRNIKLKFCRNVKDLMENYFHNFKFEGVRKCRIGRKLALPTASV